MAYDYRLEALAKQIVADMGGNSRSGGQKLRGVKESIARQLAQGIEKPILGKYRVALYTTAERNCAQCRHFRYGYLGDGKCSNPEVIELGHRLHPRGQFVSKRSMSGDCSWFEVTTLDELKGRLETARANYRGYWRAYEKTGGYVYTTEEPYSLQIVATWEFIVQRRERSDLCQES